MASTIWRGNIAFGLVSIPVKLVRAARRERTKFRHVYQPEDITNEEAEEPERAIPPSISRPLLSNRSEKMPAASAPYSEEESPVPVLSSVERVHHAAPAAEVLKAIEVEPNQYVTFHREELKALKPDTSTSIEITSFIRQEEVDPIYFDSSYYVVPVAAGEKPYAILFRAIQQSGFAALGQMAMHGREHAVMIRAGSKGLIFETLFYQNETHLEDQHAADPSLATGPEIKMAEAFIQALAAKFNPEELVDTYEKRLAALIEKRTARASVDAPASKPSTAPVVDIMEALRKSLEQAKKPPAKATSGKRRRAS